MTVLDTQRPRAQGDALPPTPTKVAQTKPTPTPGCGDGELCVAGEMLAVFVPSLPSAMAASPPSATAPRTEVVRSSCDLGPGSSPQSFSYLARWLFGRSLPLYSLGVGYLRAPLTPNSVGLFLLAPESHFHGNWSLPWPDPCVGALRSCPLFPEAWR